MRTLTALTLLAILLAGCNAPATTPAIQTPALDSTLIEKIEASAAQTMKEKQIPGLAIGIIKDKKIVYSKGFGIADIRSGTAVTPETVFQLGSDSKMMVGIAMMQLEAQGKIDLDASITTYLPYFHIADKRYKKITLRQILSHRSGLPYCIDYEKCDKLDYQSPQYDDGALERHVRSARKIKMVSAPGKAMQYSDIGFETLGDVIAKVSGQSFEDYIQQHIFMPLKMTHSSFLLRDVQSELLAAPHIVNPMLTVNSYFPYSREHAASSHLFSNVNDMNRFALTQLNRGELDGVRILPTSAYNIMWTPQIDTALPSPWEKTLGLGWFLGGPAGHHMVGHAGGDTGFSCEVIMVPDEGTAIVVMVNREYPLEDFAYQIMQWLLAAP
ncbi:MAG TPA: serine hydrolase domain-containing protein [Pseudomonadales bacterium]|nr:serine hydrolase domain-containing protein [Pseudomonadales bacterium]